MLLIYFDELQRITLYTKHYLQATSWYRNLIHTKRVWRLDTLLKLFFSEQ